MKKYLPLLLCASLGASSVLATAQALAPSPTLQSKITGKISVPLKIQGIAINTADAKTLSHIKGIGLKKAGAIIRFREQHGKFQQLSDLTHVPGISKKTLHKLTSHMAKQGEPKKNHKKNKTRTHKTKSRHQMHGKSITNS